MYFLRRFVQQLGTGKGQTDVKRTNIEQLCSISVIHVNKANGCIRMRSMFNRTVHHMIRHTVTLSVCLCVYACWSDVECRPCSDYRTSQ